MIVEPLIYLIIDQSSRFITALINDLIGDPIADKIIF